ncbi:glucosamine-6-phosphate deaminase [Nesterenkonia sp. MY13]|uniref:Glucosamine-6-phosphate deaminase n=1 Tax=Nesterenkonia sedimenti TaxID=1463632 RepID=A0A7X8TJ87_9MICC|nr:glucosamine-6-phosphate deaminase [Nesterenkonia sedimenti]NLS09762.1 glucosamine-6-phosphate deaminase [Nesterenkonia sedimenti]
MQVVIFADAQAAGAYGAGLINDRLERGALNVLGVATGSSPVPLYQALAADPHPRLTGLTAFALDEYVGLPKEHPESYDSVIDRKVRRPLGLDPARVHVPDADPERLETAGERYEQRIAEAGGVDLQILGIGATGHIGFNEPTSSLASRTRLKTLAPATRADNARFFDSEDEVPVHCITQGIGTILDAGEVLLLAQGEQKARAVAQAVEGPISSMCPASALQLHRKATLLLDEAAASQLEYTDYYRFVHQNRPDWQRP